MRATAEIRVEVHSRRLARTWQEIRKIRVTRLLTWLSQRYSVEVVEQGQPGSSTGISG